MNLSPYSAVYLVPTTGNEGLRGQRTDAMVSRGLCKDFFLVHLQSKALQVAQSEGRDLLPGTGVSAPSLWR